MDREWTTQYSVSYRRGKGEGGFTLNTKYTPSTQRTMCAKVVAGDELGAIAVCH